ncbi:hypothetical protein P6U21_29525, partial [Bacillus paranthracis]|nr:hypothetical protein [Bacillus paranthracis]
MPCWTGLFANKEQWLALACPAIIVIPALTVITPNTIVETSSLRDLISITIFSTKDATRLHSHNPYLQGSGHNITYP